MERNYTVYVHRFPDGKAYVGLTKQDLKTRWGHKGNGYKRQSVYSAIQKYGWDNIDHDVFENLTREEAQQKEKELIIQLDSINNGYNKDPGGGCGGNPWVQILYNGKYYSSEELAKMSDIEGLTGHDITNRVRYHGHTVEEALTKPLIKKNQMIDYNGDKYTYKELVNMSNVDGITTSNLNFRLKRGWSMERALSQPKNVKKQPFGVGERRYEYNGELLNSYELWQLRKEPSLTQNQITSRIDRHGWTIEDALTRPAKRYGVKYEYNGKMYTTKELAALYPENGLTCHDITDRLSRGMSVKDAVEKPSHKNKLYEYNGEMLSLRKIYDLLPDPKPAISTFYVRVRNGMDVKEAGRK